MEETKNWLKKLHEVEVEILDEIVCICEDNGLSYFLIGGTLLGAVRHKGFIPWDDDLDIAMPRADYEKFISICETELRDKYYLHDISTDKHYWLPFAKIRKNNTVFDEQNLLRKNVKKGIYVDIFPLDTTDNENKAINSKKTKRLKYLNFVLTNKMGIVDKTNVSFANKLLCALLCLIPNRWVYGYQRRLMKRDNKKQAKYVVNYGSNYHVEKQINPIDVFFPCVKIEFEGKLYNAPNKYLSVLEKLYGSDYMQLPPEEKRVTHKPLKIEFGE